MLQTIRPEVDQTPRIDFNKEHGQYDSESIRTSDMIDAMNLAEYGEDEMDENEFHGEDRGSPMQNNFVWSEDKNNLRVDSPGAVPPSEEEDVLADLTPSY